MTTEEEEAMPSKTDARVVIAKTAVAQIAALPNDAEDQVLDALWHLDTMDSEPYELDGVAYRITTLSTGHRIGHRMATAEESAERHEGRPTRYVVGLFDEDAE